MKITKTQLRKIIKEEIIRFGNNIDLPYEKVLSDVAYKEFVNFYERFDPKNEGYNVPEVLYILSAFMDHLEGYGNQLAKQMK